MQERNDSDLETIAPVAYIRSDFSSKYGIPRQPGLAKNLRASIILEPAYRKEEAVRGLAQFSHIWLIWGFSANKEHAASLTVRPPRLDGDTRIGVFASRSPFRPNGLGLSVVKIIQITNDPEFGPVIEVSGADLMNKTPIYDIKPYVPYSDSIPDAIEGYASAEGLHHLQVSIPKEFCTLLDEKKLAALQEVLAQDPRPSYQDDPNRIYGFGFAGMNVRFRIEDGIVYVTDIFEV